MLLIQNGTVYTMTRPEPIQADILIDGQKIVKIKSRLKPDRRTEVFDASGLRIYPGFIDCHTHIGLYEDGIGFEGNDTNESTDPITPQLRGIDAINPFDPAFKEASHASVTTVGTGPGSANVVGGTFCAIKTQGTCVDEMLVQEAVAMKCALGENPKRCYQGKNNNTRMASAAKLRELLFKTCEYSMKLEAAHGDPSRRPDFDMKLDAMLPVIKKQLPLKIHAHRADDICTAIRIAREFELRLTLEHVTEGQLIIPQLLDADVPLAVGPNLHANSKFEIRNMTFTTPGVLSKAGLLVSIITDAPIVPLKYLAMSAGLAVKSGMDSYEAMRAITINPAIHLGIEKQVGTLEAGKDADLVITDGDPLEMFTAVRHVLINGQWVED